VSSRPTIVILSWHPEHGSTTAGGFRRSAAVIRRFVGRGTLALIDAEPSIFRGIELGASDRLLEYRLPTFHWLTVRCRPLARALQWALAAVQLVQLGRGRWRRQRTAIYVPTSELLPCALAGVVLKFLTGSRLVMCNQNVDGIFARRIVLALHNRADAVTTVSRALAASLQVTGVSGPVSVTGAAVPEIAEPLISEPVPSMRWDGIFIGRHTQEKGIFDVLDIWERVIRVRPDATLVLIGVSTPTVDRQVEARLSPAPTLKKRVVRLGVVSDLEKFRYLRASRVLLAPSRVEGWGFAPREALSVGVPVICYDLPAYEESLPHDPQVTRIAVGDVEAFAGEVLRRLEIDGTADRIPVGRQTTQEWDEVASREWEVIVGAVHGTD
jgi:glycosyltransferase involved in cell wall biosynthesis